MNRSWLKHGIRFSLWAHYMTTLSIFTHFQIKLVVSCWHIIQEIKAWSKQNEPPVDEDNSICRLCVAIVRRCVWTTPGERCSSSHHHQRMELRADLQADMGGRIFVAVLSSLGVTAHFARVFHSFDLHHSYSQAERLISIIIDMHMVPA